MIDMSKRKETESRLPEGLYVLCKDKSEVEKKLNDLLRLFNRSLPEGQVVAIFKDGCHKVIDFFADCFAETHVRAKLICLLADICLIIHPRKQLKKRLT